MTFFRQEHFNLRKFLIFGTIWQARGGNLACSIRGEWVGLQREGTNQRLFAVSERSGARLATTRELCGLEPVLVDSQAANLRVESLPWNSKLGRRAGRASDPPPGFRQRGFDDSSFSIRIEATKRSRRQPQRRRVFRQFAFQPSLVYRKRVAIAEHNCSL